MNCNMLATYWFSGDKVALAACFRNCNGVANLWVSSANFSLRIGQCTLV